MSDGGLEHLDNELRTTSSERFNASVVPLNIQLTETTAVPIDFQLFLRSQRTMFARTKGLQLSKSEQIIHVAISVAQGSQLGKPVRVSN